jgi:hypothetical protein
MKIHEAITEAQRLYGLPQAHGAYFKFDPNNRLCACALGQALLGAGVISKEEAFDYALGVGGIGCVGLVTSTWPNKNGQLSAEAGVAFNLNDHERLPLDVIVRRLREIED